MEATLQEILDAREARVQKQQHLLQTYGKSLVCFTMNIPGPVKLDRDVSIGFFVGCRLLKDSLSGRLIYADEQKNHTGCEGYFVADMPARELKQLCLELEESSPVGRLFDMDVFDANGDRITRESMGYPRRGCLLCGQDAVVCAGRRTHSVAELRDRTDFLLYLAARQELSEYIAVRAYLALMQESNTTPKPGLVDRNNRGAHTDMDIRHFFVSANALRPFFCRFAEKGYLTRDLDAVEAFAQIRGIGMEAEEAMLKATRGVNTHKGAIFSLGLLCAVAGRLGPDGWNEKDMLCEAAKMAAGVVAQDFAGITQDTAKTAGEKLYAAYGITGIRGQAEAGYPGVLSKGLPVLKEGLAQGLSLNDAGAAALLHLLTVTEDTNIVSRSDIGTLKTVQAQVADLLQENPYPDQAALEALDRRFIEKNLSPGGTADLLAVTYFLFFLK